MDHWLPKPGPFFAGMGLSFLACVLAGRYYSQHNIFRDDLARFHMKTSSEVNFFPTPSQLLRFAEHRIPADRIGVIVGGSSVLHGIAQRPEYLWSKRMQDLLGDRFRVINVSSRGGAPHEYGNWVSEMLLKKRRRVVHVSDIFPCYYMSYDPAGLQIRDFFWAARARDLLLPDWPERAKRLEQVKLERAAERAKEPNPRLMAILDARLNFNDLWGSFRYLHFGTFYSPLLAPRLSTLFMPLRYQEDVEEVAPPIPARYLRANLRREMHILSELSIPCADGPLRKMEEDFASSISPQVRHVSVFLMQDNSPYFVNQLSPQQQRQLRENSRISAEALERYGVTLLQGDFLDETDFADRVHLTEEGGAKLAQRMSVLVREKARQAYGENP